jgi:hypothetical protein
MKTWTNEMVVDMLSNIITKVRNHEIDFVGYHSNQRSEHPLGEFRFVVEWRINKENDTSLCLKPVEENVAYRAEITPLHVEMKLTLQQKFNEQIIKILDHMALRSKYMKCHDMCPCETDGSFHAACKGCGNVTLQQDIEILKKMLTKVNC